MVCLFFMVEEVARRWLVLELRLYRGRGTSRAGKKMVMGLSRCRSLGIKHISAETSAKPAFLE